MFPCNMIGADHILCNKVGVGVGSWGKIVTKYEWGGGPEGPRIVRYDK